ncbi:MAG: phytoene desaturase family protein [Chloroflexota bacterium]
MVGSGPNGLAAGIALGRAGFRTTLFEGSATIGGGVRAEALTLPGFVHDVCSAVHPLAVASPFFRTLPLAGQGLEWVHSPAVLCHPLDGGRAVVLERSLARTAAGLGADGAAYNRLLGPLLARWPALMQDVLAPLRLPSAPRALARFALHGLLPATWLTRTQFRTEPARALLAGVSAHAPLPLNQPPSAAFGLVLALAGHAVGWPIPRGGAGSIGRALAGCFASLGGDIVTRCAIHRLEDLPPASATLLDVTPRQFLCLAGGQLPPLYRGQLRHFAYGLGTCKVDWALDAPIPWAAPECARAATVHLGGSLAEIAAAHAAAWAGGSPSEPFVILAQPTLFDPSRAPEGKHTAWAYCHVPHGSNADVTERIERQVERFAPGFRQRILARHTFTSAGLERHNPNLVGGDIGAGISNLAQLLTRPALQPNPYRTPLAGVYLCSASTPPGGGVHGMCGYHAAQAAITRSPA